VLLGGENARGAQELGSVCFQVDGYDGLGPNAREEFLSVFVAEVLLPEGKNHFLLIRPQRVQRFVHFDVMKKELHLLFLIQRDNPAIKFLEQIFDLRKSSEGLRIFEAVSKQ